MEFRCRRAGRIGRVLNAAGALARLPSPWLVQPPLRHGIAGEPRTGQLAPSRTARRLRRRFRLLEWRLWTITATPLPITPLPMEPPPGLPPGMHPPVHNEPPRLLLPEPLDPPTANQHRVVRL